MQTSRFQLADFTVSALILILRFSDNKICYRHAFLDHWASEIYIRLHHIAVPRLMGFQCLLLWRLYWCVETSGNQWRNRFPLKISKEINVVWNVLNFKCCISVWFEATYKFDSLLDRKLEKADSKWLSWESRLKGSYVGHLRRTFDTTGRQTSILGATPLARRAQKPSQPSWSWNLGRAWQYEDYHTSFPKDDFD